MAKLISIITVVLNDENGLKKTIESVLRQDYSNLEYLIIDGGSADGTLDVINKYRSCISFSLSEKDNGVYDAMNKGISKATGEYVLFLNAGDHFARDISITNLIRNSSNEDLIYGDITYQSETQQVINTSPYVLDFSYFSENTIPHPCTLIKKELFLKYGMYNEKYRICADWVFFLDVIAKHNASYKYVPGEVAVFQLGGLSSSNPERVAAEREMHLANAYPFYYSSIKKYKISEEKLVTVRTLIGSSLFLRMLLKLFYQKIRRVLFD